MPSVINTVTKAAPGDNYAVVNDVDMGGGFRVVTNIAQRDAIVSNQRKEGMLVYVLSDLHYYKLQAGLLAWTDLGISLGGGGTNPLPIINDVYLVNDVATQTKMGGIANNVYITAQAAYDAAVILQAALGGANKVVINVGVTVATTVGGVTLTANHNANIVWSGINIIASTIGIISGNNAAGNGFNVGAALINTAVRVANITIGGITTNPTGTTGSGGLVGIIGTNVKIGNINTSVTNVANTTGNGGTVTYSLVDAMTGIIGSITTSSQGATSSAGSISMNAFNTRVSVGACIASNGNSSATINLVNATITSITNISTSTVSGSGPVSLENCTCGSVTITAPQSTIIAPNINFINTKLTGAVNISNNGTGTTFMNITENSVVRGILTFGASVTLKAITSSLFKIINLGNNSNVLNCVVDSSSSSGTSINGIGTGCKIYNTTILPNGASLSIDNGSPVTVTGTSSVFENGVGANVTVI